MLILKGLVGGLFQVVLFGGLLVLPAGLMPGGTWYWDRALIFLGVYGVIMVGGIVALGVLAPDSLAARTRAPGGMVLCPGTSTQMPSRSKRSP